MSGENYAPATQGGSSTASSEAAPAAPPVPWGLIYLLARVFYGMRARTEEALRPEGLTSMQFTILAGLQRWKGLSSAELSRRFEVTPQTMGEMIANLERRGLVARRQDPANRRALKLDLTPEGERQVKLSTASVNGVESSLLEGLSPQQAEGLRQGLTALFAHIGLRPD